MDQNTYEQLMQVQISIDELKEKMDLVLDEIDDLKKPRGQTQEEQGYQSQQGPPGQPDQTDKRDQDQQNNMKNISIQPRCLQCQNHCTEV